MRKLKNEMFSQYETAVRCGVYCNDKPCPWFVDMFLEELSDKNKYSIKVEMELEDGEIVFVTYYNEKFINKFIKYFKDAGDDNYKFEGKNYRFNKFI